jgi:hypothetical protein
VRASCAVLRENATITSSASDSSSSATQQPSDLPYLVAFEVRNARATTYKFYVIHMLHKQLFGLMVLPSIVVTLYVPQVKCRCSTHALSRLCCRIADMQVCLFYTSVC